ncbi:hypothetical protein B0H34DRAFT_711453 [Crassisporium funariophilum]|nr:hypothetical protein B0H34DRAFT_711453 [Crassisporium funariophilum]
MVKGNGKSSASSATRKKHLLKKNAPPIDDPPIDNPSQKKLKTKAERGKAKKEPRVKVYIPPVKPAPVQPDPLETTGLGRTLPADLLVVLRNVGKKAQVTKIRALEELQGGWVERCLKEKDEALAYTLVQMLPVWLHHVSALLVHPSRRVRVLAASLHSSFLRIPAVRDQILFFLRETASPSQTESILGTWCLAAHDVDRTVSASALKSWKETILVNPSEEPSTSSSGKHLVLDEALSASIVTFVQRTALDPSGVYAYLNPLPPIFVAPAQLPVSTVRRNQQSGKNSGVGTPRREDGDQTPRSKVDEQEEGESDRRARLRIGAFGAARWILGTLSALSEDLIAFFSNPALWTALQPNESCPWVEVESFGFAQPNVRKAAWGLVQTLLNSHKGQMDSFISTLGVAILRSAWMEMDSLVQSVMWQPLLTFLKHFPQSWTLDDSSSKDDEEDNSGAESDGEEHLPTTPKDDVPSPPRTSQAYQEFLQFLQLGCSGSPLQGYPTVVIIVSTIPSVVITSSTSEPSASPLTQFFTSFWAAIDGRALSSLHRSANSAAFLSSLLECMVFLIKRMRNDTSRAIQDQDGNASTTSPRLGGTALSSDNAAAALVVEQYGRVWDELRSKRLKVEERAAARLLGKTLEALAGVDQPLMDAAWETLAGSIRDGSGKDEETSLVSAVLKVFYDRFKDGTVLKQRVVLLVKEVLEAEVERSEKVLEAGFATAEEEAGNKAGFVLFVSMLDQFREGLFFDEKFASQFDTLLSRHAFLVLRLSPQLFLSYLLYRKDEAKCSTVWHSLLSSIASAARAGQLEPKYFAQILDAAQQGRLPKYLKPKEGELDRLVGDLLENALNAPAGSEDVGLVKQILIASDYFLSNAGYNTFVQVIIATFTSHIDRVVNGEEVQEPSTEVTVDFIEAVFSYISRDTALLKSLLPDIFLFAYLLPLCDISDLEEQEQEDAGSTSHIKAKGLWEEWIKVAEEGLKDEVVEMIKNKLRTFVEDTRVHPLPEDVLLMLARRPPGVQVNLLQDIFPSATQLDSMLDSLSSDAIDPGIAVLDPLLPVSPKQKAKNHQKPATDQRGLASYARSVNALLQVFIQDRQLAKRNLWALRHFWSLSLYAQDLRNVPFAVEDSPVFDAKATSTAAGLGVLRDIVARVKQVSVYVLNSTGSAQDDWRTIVLERFLNEGSAIAKLKGKQGGKDGLDDVQAFLYDVIAHAREKDAVRDTRVLRMVLEPLLKDGVGGAEADMWVQLGRKFEKTAPQTCITIISAITNTGTEPPKLDRFRNELAASLLGIKPTNANTDGLLTLRKLAACAPDPEGDVVFLQPLRAVNVVKACQAWVLAEGDDDGEDDDEGLEEEVESAMLPIFMHLAPILQNSPGGHWAFVFDVLEGVLERASSVEGGSKDAEEQEGEESGKSGSGGAELVALARALRLVVVLEELAKRNKALMAEWEGRRMGVLVVIRDLGVLGRDAGEVSSVPRSACRELVLSIVQHLPESLIDIDTLPKMCHLIEDPSPTVQKMAYQLLRAAAKKRTEYYVIEAAVDTENTVKAVLPQELMEILQRELHFGYGYAVGGADGAGLAGGDQERQDGEGEGGDGYGAGAEEEEDQNVFGYLLGWMLLFDLFQDASFKVKSNYIEQLRNEDVVVGHFIPCFLGLLRLDKGGLLKAFKLDVWAVNVFYVDLYEPGSPHTIPVLAAHVYYRALLTMPSLIHSWVLDCKDRQLTTTFTSYTSTYFSPVLIKAELEHVRQRAASGGSSAAGDIPALTGDNMTVKVAAAINEVVAAYTVDEHQLEIKLRIPMDWPLHKIEVRDGEVRRVGVDENRWRAWVLGVQQTIWAHVCCFFFGGGELTDLLVDVGFVRMDGLWMG